MSGTHAQMLARYKIPEPVLRTISTLKNHHYQAWLVGGSIRDIICGRPPKDFDIATDAHPEQICRLFKRSRIVGSRFPVVHVRCEKELLEVSTLRREPDGSPDRVRRSVRNPKKNYFGKDIRADVLRRDYTINALYYDPIAGEVHDHLGGCADIQKRQIRSIGEPKERFNEDPVRMLRGLYFSAKLNFKIESGLAMSIRKCAPKIHAATAGRLNHEYNKMFLSGHAVAIWALLNQYGFVSHLFPSVWALLRDGKRNDLKAFCVRLFEDTDQRVASGQPVHLQYIFAALLWYPLQAMTMSSKRNKHHKKLQEQKYYAMGTCAPRIINAQKRVSAILFRQQRFLNEVWDMQYALVSLSPKTHPKVLARLLTNPQFKASLCLLRARAEHEPQLKSCIEFWNKRQNQESPNSIPAHRRATRRPGYQRGRTH
jgi:poly(A) polymerase